MLRSSIIGGFRERIGGERKRERERRRERRGVEGGAEFWGGAGAVARK